MIKKLKYKEKFLEKLKQNKDENLINEKYYHIILNFFESYILAAKKGFDFSLFDKFLDLIKDQFKEIYKFSIYHKKIRKPFDYFRFGIDFLKPVIDLENSSIFGKDNLEKIINFLKSGENVILLANHQTEGDPQGISILLDEKYSEIAKKMIFVAGERVIKDPLAIPFSMGCDLLCIYSKKHINNIPKLKEEKLLHNRKTMQVMRDLLSEGGQIIYVAPSGGRDRPNNKKEIEIAPFDSQSIEMFYLISKRAKKKTHFFPLTLSTYNLMPPPDIVEKDLGEKRITKGGKIHIAFGKEIDMDNYPGNNVSDKKERRVNRANFIHEIVKKTYKKISGK